MSALFDPITTFCARRMRRTWSHRYPVVRSSTPGGDRSADRDVEGGVGRGHDGRRNWTRYVRVLFERTLSPGTLATVTVIL